MERLSQAVDILRRAESQIRGLLLDSAGDGAYLEVAVLAAWAQQLHQLASQSNARNGPSNDQTELTPSVEGARQQEPTHRKGVKGKKGDYPRFYREREELVKVGWSKKQKAEYRHKASKSVVLLVARGLQRRAADAERFALEELLPILDPQTNSEIPSYQVYLVLAWLRKENLIMQHGRQGYSLSPNINLTDAVEERWKLLPKS
ncbi:MAG: hypothetical protein GYA33_07950 [Thermogutta sp.]|nr:hypothetical protein [Thermogutta sp.]